MQDPRPLSDSAGTLNPSHAPRQWPRPGRWESLRAAVEGRRRHLRTTGAVALTFDDGPDPVSTPLVLDALGRLGATATFFCVGDHATAHPELVARMVGEGHAVGSHSSSHPDLSALTVRERVRELRKGRAQVERALGRRTRLFRPPSGHAGPLTLLAMRLAGVKGWLWSVDPKDYRPAVSAEDIAGAVAGIGSGDIVLLHDTVCRPLAPASLDRSSTVDALDAIVAMVRDRGLELVTLH
jgi:peptidoglycan/xylan/chitin deacetylase (PgdA/CDA1 family)